MRSHSRKPTFFYTRRERKVGWIIADDVHRPLGYIKAWYNAVEVNQGYLPLHSETEPHILVVAWIGPSISIAQLPVGTKGIVVGPCFAFDNRHCRDTERNFAKKLGFENALRSHQWNALPIVGESTLQDLARECTILWSQSHLFLQESERGHANVCVSALH